MAKFNSIAPIHDPKLTDLLFQALHMLSNHWHPLIARFDVAVATLCPSLGKGISASPSGAHPAH